MNNDNKEMLKKRKGLVISDKMDKTVVVAVTEIKTKAKYLKKFKSTQKYKVHDEKNEYKVGDLIYFSECRPLSKDKCWRAVGLAKKSDQQTNEE